MDRRKRVEEVVDDSEPEREELRRREKEERRRKRKRDVEIIEVTDGEDTNKPEASKGSMVEQNSNPKIFASPLNHVRIEVAEFQSIPWSSASTLEISDEDTHVSSPHPEPPINDVSPAVARSAISTPPVATLSMSKDSESEEDELGMGLARFAYKTVSRPSLALHPRDGPSCSTTLAGVAGTVNSALNKKPLRRAIYRPTMDIPDAMVARLMTCVSCNLKWTARKTGVEKMKHVQSCARRNSLTDETVRVLIRQEMDKIPIAAEGKGKGQLEPLKEANTVLEDVLNDHAPKKRGKRPEVLKTVKSLTETRNVILDRARIILENKEDVDFSVQTQAFGPSKLVERSGVVDLFPPTQPFGRCALQGQTTNGSKPSTSDSADAGSGFEHGDESDVDKIPPTQEFGPSKLKRSPARPTSLNSSIAGLVPNSPLVSAISQEPSIPSSPTSSVVERFPPHVIPFIDNPSLHAREHSSHRRPRMSQGESVESLVCDHSMCDLRWTPDLSPEKCMASREGPGTPIAVYDKFSLEIDVDDDAYLHFDPSIETHNQHRPTMLQNDLIPRDPHLIQLVPNSTHTTSRKYRPFEESATNKAIPRKKTTGKGKQRKGNSDEPPSEVLDDNWELKMKNMIIENNILHQRILRYEPIHFEVFFQLAIEQEPGLPPHGLRVKLRSLLDKLAVNFYGADPVGRRR